MTASERAGQYKIIYAKKSKPAGASLPAADEAVFEKLRALRSEIAKEEKVPPYIVFSDKTLAQFYRQAICK